MPLSPGDRLDSWKDIAAYLNRGVRTVRRWEHEEGMPVHRQLHRTQGSVYAFKSEIDVWRQSAARVPATVSAPAVSNEPDHTKSIAVLPFTNLSADPDNAFFADGLTEEVTADLSQVRALRVISRTSSMTFRGTTKDAGTIARELGVRYLLEGSVRRAGSRLRITAQLIDAAADSHLWSEKFDGDVEDVFAFQERLARTIVDALELRLSTDEARRLIDHPIANVEAYDRYLRARQERWRWRQDAIDRAVQLLNESLAIVGDNAVLFAALGLVHLQCREAGIDLSERPLLAAEACAEKVFRLEPAASAAGLQLRGWIHYSRGRVQEAVRDLKASLEIDPSNADTLGLLSNCCLISGKVPAARPHITRLLAVDPLTPINRCLPGFADLMEGHAETALEPYRQMFELDAGNPMTRLFYVWVLILNQQLDAAGAIVEGFPVEVRSTIPARIARFLTLAAAGRADDAHAMVTSDVEDVAYATELFPRLLASGYALAGSADRALHWLEIAIGRGFINYPFLSQYDPCTKALRSDARFIRLMAMVRERWERFDA